MNLRTRLGFDNASPRCSGRVVETLAILSPLIHALGPTPTRPDADRDAWLRTFERVPMKPGSFAQDERCRTILRYGFKKSAAK